MTLEVTQVLEQQVAYHVQVGQFQLEEVRDASSVQLENIHITTPVMIVSMEQHHLRELQELLLKQIVHRAQQDTIRVQLQVMCVHRALQDTIQALERDRAHFAPQIHIQPVQQARVQRVQLEVTTQAQLVHQVVFVLRVAQMVHQLVDHVQDQRFTGVDLHVSNVL